MPFTFDGEWIPKKKEYPPLKIMKEKRKGSFVTIIRNIPLENEELKALVSKLKKHLACGGSLKESEVEIQGDKMAEVAEFLVSQGIKVPKGIISK